MDGHTLPLAMRAQIEPDTIAYNTALSACARASQVQPMLSLFRQMNAEGVPLDGRVNWFW